MSLSERLEAARRARLGLAGPASDEPTDVEAVVPLVLLRDEPVIEVGAAPGPHPVAPPAEPGDEATCPNCQAGGRIDMVDLVGHTTHYSCLNCGTLWQLRSHHPASR